MANKGSARWGGERHLHRCYQSGIQQAVYVWDLNGVTNEQSITSVIRPCLSHTVAMEKFGGRWEQIAKENVENYLRASGKAHICRMHRLLFHVMHRICLLLRPYVGSSVSSLRVGVAFTGVSLDFLSP